MSRCLHALLRVSRGRGLSSAGLALVLLVGLAAQQEPAPVAPGGTRTLAPAPPPAAAASAPQRRAVVPRPAAPPRQMAAVRPRAQRAAAAAPDAARPAPPRTAPAYGPMERDYQREAHGDGLCPAGTQSTSLAIGCRRAEVRTTGSGYVLRFSVCTATAARPDLRFLTEAEVDMRVVDGDGRHVWTWQPARAFLDEPHVLVADAGSCWVWQTPWAQVDDSGRAVQDGAYDLQVDFLEVDDADTYAHRFSVRRG